MAALHKRRNVMADHRDLHMFNDDFMIDKVLSCWMQVYREEPELADQDDEAGDGAGPAPSEVAKSGATPQAVASGYKVAVRRSGPAVTITLTSGSEYASIELYDSLIQALARGSLSLKLNVPCA